MSQFDGLWKEVGGNADGDTRTDPILPNQRPVDTISVKIRYVYENCLESLSLAPVFV
jgi:hypothetical protein